MCVYCVLCVCCVLRASLVECACAGTAASIPLAAMRSCSRAPPCRVLRPCGVALLSYAVCCWMGSSKWSTVVQPGCRQSGVGRRQKENLAASAYLAAESCCLFALCSPLLAERLHSFSRLECGWLWIAPPCTASCCRASHAHRRRCATRCLPPCWPAVSARAAP